MPPTTISRSLRADVRPRELWAWAMYDFANSGYTTVVITALFNALLYFAQPGALTLAVCLAYLTWAQSQGMTATQFVPVTMLLTAGMFALASLPTFLLLRKRADRQTRNEIQSRMAA